MDGVLLVDKPENITSHDVVLHIRKLFRTRKVGHAGTLDPFATGLLILCLGEATKIVQYLTDREKEYIGVMKLGETTDTQDCTGTIQETREIPTLKNSDIANVFTTFIGKISQIPPMFSARRIQGKRLYEIARKGNTVEREARDITIHELKILDITLPYIRFQVSCSKGTYIRTLAHDIGEALGCGGHLTTLERTQIGEFSLNKAFSFEQLAQKVKRLEHAQCLFPLDQALAFFPSITIGEQAATRLTNGTQISLTTKEIAALTEQGSLNQIVRVYHPNGKFIALAKVAGITCQEKTCQQLQPIKVFYQNPSKRL